MKKYVFLLIAFMFSCSPTNKENIIGIWISKENALEFMTNGKVVVYFTDGDKSEFEYSFLDDQKMLFETGKPKVFLVQFNNDNKKLVLTDEEKNETLIYSSMPNLAEVLVIFQTERDQKEKKKFMHDLILIGSMAQQYYRKPASMGGGGKSFKGFEVPHSLKKTNNGNYKVKIVSDESIVLIGFSEINENIKAEVIVTPLEIEAQF